MPEAKLPKLKMFSMTLREMDKLQAFIDKNLVREFTQLINREWQPQCFFKEKKDGSLIGG